MMKIIILLSLVSLVLHAEEFIFYSDSNKSEKISIQRLNGLHVNARCLKEKKDCLKVIESIKKDKVELKNVKGPLGNPASINCKTHHGQSEILRDHQNNEYDYCLLEKKYLIDSWDLMK